MTKLDVLDGIEELQVGVGYELQRRAERHPAVRRRVLAECEPVYEEMPGWSESTVGVTRFEELPPGARNYLKRIEEVCGVPIDLISTGPDRDETIVRRHPFEAGLVMGRESQMRRAGRQLSDTRRLVPRKGLEPPQCCHR